MKRKLIAIAVALFVSGGLVITDGTFANAPASRARFNISRRGALLELFDSHGARVGGGVLGDGIEVQYKTGGRVKFTSSIDSASTIGLASAINEETTITPLQEQQPSLRTFQPASATSPASASVTAQTGDRALEIKSKFFHDERSRELVIVRTFRNLTDDVLTLQTVLNHVDAKLTVRGLNHPSKIVRMVQAPMCRITAGVSQNSDCSLSYFKCPVGPTCPWKVCPPGDQYISARLLSGPEPSSARPALTQQSSTQLGTQAGAEGDDVLLQWPDTAFKPLAKKSAAGSMASIVIRVAL